MILYHKLYDIDNNGSQTISKSLKPAYRAPKNKRANIVKNEIKALAQENLFILKRLLSKDSEYNTQKLEKEYQKYQKYKKSICHYPSINFYNSKNKNAPIVQSYKFNEKKEKKIETVKLPKIGGVTLKSTYKVFHTTHGTLDERYYKEAMKSSRLTSANKSKYKATKYETKNSLQELCLTYFVHNYPNQEDIVLIKGSHGINLKNIVNYLV